MHWLLWGVVVVVVGLSVLVYMLGAWLGHCADEAQDPANW